VLGDAIAVLVLEAVEEPPDGAIALVEGYASGNEAYHATAPDPTGGTLARVMLCAIDDAGLTPDDVGYVNAHGTATPSNDAAELAAIEEVFRYRRSAPVSVSSTKHLTGHCLGAAGAIEAAVCCIAIQDGLVPGNHFTHDPLDTATSVELPRVTRAARVDHAISTNLAFSGNVAAVVFGSTP
jgi:3-oxoacyl-[acyl-carrier-protein] synthase II